MDGGESFVEEHVGAVGLFEGEVHEFVGELIVGLGSQLPAEALGRDLMRIERLDLGVVEEKPPIAKNAAAAADFAVQSAAAAEENSGISYSE